MKKSAIQKIYAITIIILLIGILAMQKEKFLGLEIFEKKSNIKQATQFNLDDVKELYPNASSFTIRNDSIFIFSNKEIIGWAYNTSPVSDSIVGYTSSVPLLIGFNNNDILVGIKLLKNYESPDFVDNIMQSGFVNSWDNMHITKITNTHVDAVSGSTLTSAAIIKTLNHSIGKISNQNISFSVKPDIVNILQTISGYLLIAIALLQFFFSKKMKKIRTVYQVLVVLILGFWLGTFLSIFSFQNWIIHGIDLPAKVFVFIVLILSIALPLFTSKSFYCSHLCAFGASQDLLGKIRKERVKLPNNLKQFLSTLREKVFATIMLLLFTGVSLDLTNIEPFSAFLFRSASIPIIVLAVSFLLLSIFIPRPWCNYACPTGYILEIIRKPIKN